MPTSADLSALFQFHHIVALCGQGVSDRLDVADFLTQVVNVLLVGIDLALLLLLGGLEDQRILYKILLIQSEILIRKSDESEFQSKNPIKSDQSEIRIKSICIRSNLIMIKNLINYFN